MVTCSRSRPLYRNIPAGIMEGGPFPSTFVADIDTLMTPSVTVCEQGTGSNDGTAHVSLEQDWFG